MNLYLEKCLELLYDRHHCRICTDGDICPTKNDLEHVLVIIKQQNNLELAEILGLDQ